MAQFVTVNDFETEVLGASLPVLVDFYADWCGPCKMMSPVVDALAEQLADKMKDSLKKSTERMKQNVKDTLHLDPHE